MLPQNVQRTELVDVEFIIEDFGKAAQLYKFASDNEYRLKPQYIENWKKILVGSQVENKKRGDEKSEVIGGIIDIVAPVLYTVNGNSVKSRSHNNDTNQVELQAIYQNLLQIHGDGIKSLVVSSNRNQMLYIIGQQFENHDLEGEKLVDIINSKHFSLDKRVIEDDIQVDILSCHTLLYMDHEDPKAAHSRLTTKAFDFE